MRRIIYCLIALLGCVTALAGARLPAASAAGPACTVSYTVSSQWSTGFTVQIAVTNNGPALTSWDLQYAYDGNQQLSNGWSATWSQTGENVTASNTSWNGSLADGASVTIGAQFSYSGSNAAPTAFTLNGTACNGGTATPTASTSPSTSPSTSTSPTTTPPVGPAVSITSPTPGSTALYGSTVALSASASAGGAGTVTSVSFYESHYCPGSEPADIKLGTVTTAPYTFQWTDVPLDHFSIAAVVTTSTGASAMSSVVEMTTTSSVYASCATQNYVPVVAVAAPQNGAALDSSSTVPVTALVGTGAGSGTVSSVTLAAYSSCGTSGTFNLGTVTAAPYSVQWADPPAGHYVVTASVADSSYTQNPISEDEVEVTAGPNGVAPTCPPPPPPSSPAPTPVPSATSTPTPVP